MSLPEGQRHPAHRVDQPCHACHGFDRHPRHIHAGPDASGTMVVTARHMDCCRAAGCPDGSCHQILAASGEKRGDELLAHIFGAASQPHTTPEGEAWDGAPAPEGS